MLTVVLAISRFRRSARKPQWNWNIPLLEEDTRRYLKLGGEKKREIR